MRRATRAHRSDGAGASSRDVAAAVPEIGRGGERAGGFVGTQGILAQVKAIADTGLLVAFGNRTDHHHAWALEIARRVTEPLLTCDAVLAEAAFHLGNARLVLDFVREGMVRPAFVVADHAAGWRNWRSAMQIEGRIWRIFV